ncbi:hypothetical protein GUITHDRAFT_102301 [Guillardia theta CCMP2712]|uniref:Peptidase M13 C-terminal domain-containing protein n=1 Tax=Guillardia theta (strain CCMP2712) TaxID=905079 RepID=L1JTP9_GUITC|nr:hypothetical protein GUITHDRAFT_102301 [Guillardia theta CCMP2712]EKX51694.1 hypothetical protein GUITHDRAFT_102301 [Guillardia theta CCMP2712]|eukprot:XP_005838674.1 hypothetical protein GUITHDRAFT_102301 [Guillardia theta CCMP2712]
MADTLGMRSESIAATSVNAPPFFDNAYSLAVVYGGLGSVIGHEITHGFDVNGAKYDEDANRKNWWTDVVKQLFDNKTECLRKLYANFEIAGSKVDGQLTLGENMADHGGLKVSLDAFLESVKEAPPCSCDVESLIRVFFISYAQLWCTKSHPGQAKVNAITDKHAPLPFRANGAVSQNSKFAEVFRCKQGAAMNPIHKCSVWRDSQTEVLAQDGM